MQWIGLTGGIATGKSTVSRILVQRGHAVVDADQLARDVVKAGTDGYQAVVQAFGPDAVAPNGELDRKKIGAIVFRDKSKLDLLESIIHPRVKKLAQTKREELAFEGRKLAFYDVPLLFEKSMKPLFDHVVVVACRPEVQLERLIKREGLSEEEAKRRISAQLPIIDKVKLADAVIRNDGSVGDLEKAVADFLARILPSPN